MADMIAARQPQHGLAGEFYSEDTPATILE
jgi:hypothetical protein